MDLLTHINSQDENIICENMNLGQDETPTFQHVAQLFVIPVQFFHDWLNLENPPAGLALLLGQSCEGSLGTKG